MEREFRNRRILTYLQGENSIPTVKINGSSVQCLWSSVMKGDQDILRNLCNDDDVKKYSIIQVPDDPTEF